MHIQQKSTRHSNITGQFAEGLVLYLLSRDGFESARIDHTGIDLLARNRRTEELMGVSVKSRSRYPGTESAAVSWNVTDFAKVEAACKAFACKPYYAIVVDGSDRIQVFVAPLDVLKTVAWVGEKRVDWRMTKEHLERYNATPEIKRVELSWSAGHWWNEQQPGQAP
jgi:hypothetical protein